MPKLNLEQIFASNATGYPAPHHLPVAGRWCRRLAPMAGLTAMGASHITLEPGAWSSQRHWHRGEDELLIMLSGQAVLVENETRTLVQAGDICAWAAGVENGHHLINESPQACHFVAISAGANRGGSYPDIDMMWDERGYCHKDGTPYPTRPQSEG